MERRRALARPRPGPSVRYLGAAARRPLRARVRLARRTAHRVPGGRDRASRAPVSDRADVASFTGIARRALSAAFERIPLRRFLDEGGKELLDVRRAPLPDPETPAPIRFLPAWDATLLTHARRTQILPERYRALVFNTKSPHSIHTFLVDGQVAGSWRHEHGRIVTEPFEPVSTRTRRALDDEAAHLVELFVTD